MADESLMLKIKKLLALAGDGRGNEAEMANALERAHALLQEHNLTMAEIDALEDDPHKDGNITQTRFVDTDTGRASHWRWLIWDSVARLYYGNLCRSTGSIDGQPCVFYRIIAHEDNAMVAAVVARFVVSQALALSGSLYGEWPRSFKESFLKGISWRVVARVDDMIAKAKANKAPVGSNALITLSSLYDKSEAQIEAYIEKEKIVFKQGRSTQPSNKTAMALGIAAGGKISLAPPLPSNTHAQIGARH